VLDLETSGKNVLYPFKWTVGTAVPAYEDMRQLSIHWDESIKKNSFISRFGKTPPTTTLFVPSWLNWALTISDAHNLKDNKLIELIDLDNKIAGPISSIFLLDKKDKSFEYQIKVTTKTAERNKLISWCAIEIRESDAASSLIDQVYFHDPRTCEVEKTKLKGNTPKWMTKLPFGNIPPDSMSIDEIRVGFGENAVSMIGGSWTPANTDKPAECLIGSKGISQLIAQKTGVTSIGDSRIKLLVIAKSEGGFLQLSSKLIGVFDKDGAMQVIDDQLHNEVMSLSELNLREYGDLDAEVKKAISHLLISKDVPGLLGQLRKTTDEFINQTLKKRRTEIKQDDADTLKSLNELEDGLKTLADKMFALRTRYDSFVGLRSQLDEIEITALKVSYELFEKVDKKRGDKTITAYVVDYANSNSVVSTTPEEASQ
jgi:hypothetical protein